MGDYRRLQQRLLLTTTIAAAGAVPIASFAFIPQLQLLPALVGFLLYKPALLVQAALDS